jgi:hypothetical protein
MDGSPSQLAGKKAVLAATAGVLAENAREMSSELRRSQISLIAFPALARYSR